MRRLCIFLGLMLGMATVARANPVGIGDIYLLLDSSSGTVTVTVDNNTGPSGESFPTFPVLDSLDFSNVMLTLNCFTAVGDCQTDLGGASETIPLGTLASGNSDSSQVFSSTDLFSSITVTADLSLTHLNIDNGIGGSVPFTGSASFSDTLSPHKNGQYLVPFDLSNPGKGFDKAILFDRSPSVPEPSSFVLIATALFGVYKTKSRSLRRWMRK